MAEAGRKLQQPEVCHLLSRGSWPQLTGPLAVVGCTDSHEGLASDLRMLTGTLVAAVAAVAVMPTSGVLDSSCGLRPALELM